MPNVAGKKYPYTKAGKKAAKQAKKKMSRKNRKKGLVYYCLLYTSPSPRDGLLSRMPSSA